MWAVAILYLCLQAATVWGQESFLDPHTTTVTADTPIRDHLVNVIDGDPETFFESRGCLPFLYYPNPDSNALLDACENPGACKSTNLKATSETDLNDLTDGWTYTELKMEAASATGPVTIDIPLPKPQQLQFVNIYAWYGPGTTYLRLYNNEGTMVHEWALTEADKEHPFPMEVPVDDIISKISLEFDSLIYVKDIDAIGENGCMETIIIEMDQEREVGGVSSLHHVQGEGQEMQVWLSTDNVTWTHAGDLAGEANNTDVVNFNPIPAKFIKLVLTHGFAWHVYAFIHEIEAFGSNGVIVTEPAATSANPATLREMFGVNGEWGWGTGQQSPDLNAGEGASIYSPLASHARNVHAMDWDVSDPDNVPDYDNMAAGGGTEANFWLNWDTEYAEWVKAKMDVDASIGLSFPPSAWNNLDVSAHDFGQTFAKHFGPKNGNGLVTSVEVGNEPEGYSAAQYNELLKFMAKGLKDGDPNMVVLPAAFQADNRGASNSYIGNTVSQDVEPFIDALNYHQSSFMTRPNGLQVATYPENPDSDFNALTDMIAWRDANMPGKPIWVTEWGWDSPGAGQSCLFPECVSEAAAATYATRGLLIQARSGVERSYWYDYANQDCDDSVGCRSGLTGDTQVNFEKKEAYAALQGLLDVMGDARFLDVIQEDDQAYVYAFGDTQDDKMMKYIVAWRPVDVDADHSTATVSVPVDATPVAAFCQDDTGFTSCPGRQPSASSGGTMSLEVSPRPMIVQVQETSLG